jgi:hypothetical protein
VLASYSQKKGENNNAKNEKAYKAVIWKAIKPKLFKTKNLLGS